MSNKAQVLVNLRIRPPPVEQQIQGQLRYNIQKDQNDRGFIFTLPSNNNTNSDIGNGPDREFRLDNILVQSSTQEDVFMSIGQPLCDHFLDGYNSTILAYGPTNSGKTYSIVGEGPETAGIIPRSFEYLFHAKQARSAHRELNFSCSFIEIYLDKVYDLLADGEAVNARPVTAKVTFHNDQDDNNNINVQTRSNSNVVNVNNTNREALEVREQPGNGQPYVSGLTVQNVNSPAEMMNLLNRGLARRTTYETLSNRRSSRSHAIFTIVCLQRERYIVSGMGQANGIGSSAIKSQLSFVDLAGSERLNIFTKSNEENNETMDARRYETASINRSLSSLGNVITALSYNSILLANNNNLAKTKLRHVPYRDSKLTRVLQSSLGGNCFTGVLCVADVSISQNHKTAYEDLLGTLSFANRCRNVASEPTISFVDTSGSLQEARLLKLQSQLAEAQIQLRTEKEKVQSLERMLSLAKGDTPQSGKTGQLGSQNQFKKGDLQFDNTVIGGTSVDIGDHDSQRLLEVQRDNNMYLRRKLDQRAADLREIQARSQADRVRAKAVVEQQRLKLIEYANSVRVAREELAAGVNASEKRHAEEIERLVSTNQALISEQHKVSKAVPKLTIMQASLGEAAGSMYEAVRAEFMARETEMLINVEKAKENSCKELEARLRDEFELERAKLEKLIFEKDAEIAELRKNAGKSTVAIAWLGVEWKKLYELICDAQAGLLTGTVYGQDRKSIHNAFIGTVFDPIIAASAKLNGTRKTNQIEFAETIHNDQSTNYGLTEEEYMQIEQMQQELHSKTNQQNTNENGNLESFYLTKPQQPLESITFKDASKQIPEKIITRSIDINNNNKLSDKNKNSNSFESSLSTDNDISIESSNNINNKDSNILDNQNSTPNMYMYLNQNQEKVIKEQEYYNTDSENQIIKTKNQINDKYIKPPSAFAVATALIDGNLQNQNSVSRRLPFDPMHIKLDIPENRKPYAIPKVIVGIVKESIQKIIKRFENQERIGLTEIPNSSRTRDFRTPNEIATEKKKLLPQYEIAINECIDKYVKEVFTDINLKQLELFFNSNTKNNSLNTQKINEKTNYNYKSNYYTHKLQEGYDNNVNNEKSLDNLYDAMPAILTKQQESTNTDRKINQNKFVNDYKTTSYKMIKTAESIAPDMDQVHLMASHIKQNSQENSTSKFKRKININETLRSTNEFSFESGNRTNTASKKNNTKQNIYVTNGRTFYEK